MDVVGGGVAAREVICWGTSSGWGLAGQYVTRATTLPTSPIDNHALISFNKQKNGVRIRTFIKRSVQNGVFKRTFSPRVV